MKRQKDMTLKDELPRRVGAQYATGEEGRNSPRKNEEAEPKWKHTAVDVASGKIKSGAVKKNIAWNVKFMNQRKLEVVKPEMARVNIDVFGNSELKRNWNEWI